MPETIFLVIERELYGRRHPLFHPAFKKREDAEKYINGKPRKHLIIYDVVEVELR